MEDFKSMYSKLIVKVSEAINLLIEAQKEAEEIYISMGNELIIENN